MKNIKGLILKELLTSIVLISALSLSGCGGNGSDGTDGAAGADGAVGPSGSVAPIGTLVATETMSSKIIGATFNDGVLTVNFTVTDDKGYNYLDMTTLSKSLRFTLAQLQPANSSKGDSTYWTREGYDRVSANINNLVLNNDGSYTYTFSNSVTDFVNDDGITHIPEHTHRVGFQIGDNDLPIMNGTFDWQPSTGNTEGITNRKMVAEEQCNNCHGELSFHGDKRIDTDFCVTCHNPDLKDDLATAWNDTADFKVMIHKIHRGANLPSVIAGGEYNFGANHDYSHTQLPMDIRNCTQCHDAANEKTPEAINWINAPSIAACGSCHDDIDFSKGGEDPKGHPGGAVADNAECALCHGEGRFVSTADKHMGVMTDKEYARKAIMTIPKAVRVNLTNGDIEVDVMITLEGVGVTELHDNTGEVPHVGQSAKFGKYGRGADNGALAINWDKGTGYQLNHKEVPFNDCTPDGAGLFTCSYPGLLAGITATDVITVTTVDVLVCMNEQDGKIVACDSPASEYMVVAQVESTPTFAYFLGDGKVTTESYNKIGADQASCQGCHADQKFHHGATELGQCKTCHNATRTSSSRGTGDLKRHVHFFHSALAVNVIDKEGLPPADYAELINELPVNIDNCNSCHSKGQFDLPIVQNSRPSAFNDNKWVSPTAVVCASCHISLRNLGLIDPNKPAYMDNSAITPKQQAVLDHMIQNGAIFGADTFEKANKVESCAVCHAIGNVYGVDKVHTLH